MSFQLTDSELLASSTPQCVGHEGLAVPAFAHRLEATRTAAILRPRLFELEVMGQVYMPPLFLFLSKRKFPVEVPQHLLLVYKLSQRAVTLSLFFFYVLILCPDNGRATQANYG